MTIFITGANRGIGAELLRQYAARGEKVIATTRREIPVELKELADWHQLDVTSQLSFDALKTRLDGCCISLLICNAGVYLDRNENLADGFAPDLWADTFAANVTGPFLTVQNLLPNLQVNAGAKVAVIASKMGSNVRATGGSYSYRASKAAAINLTTNLSLDLKHLGISVGAYHPGWVRTDMGTNAADIDVKTATNGLLKRLDALSIDTTGCFESYNGESLPY